MVAIGTMNMLKVASIMKYGAQLVGGDGGDIFLPAVEVPPDCRPGDELEVFVFTDREGILRATAQKPKAMVGQFATLQVVANAEAGTFLDWGLRNDLFVPKGEQLVKMVEGQAYVVFLTIDPERGRIIASSKLDKFFSRQAPPYSEGEAVDLVVYAKTELGYKAVVNGRHGGLLYRNEVFQEMSVGQELQGYIKKIREDFKIDLILQPSGYQKVADVSQTILQTIIEQGGKVDLTDKSSSADIYARFRVSKKTFKKAVGALYKKKLITINAGDISVVGKDSEG